jgi:hypothetical protein
LGEGGLLGPRATAGQAKLNEQAEPYPESPRQKRLASTLIATIQCGASYFFLLDLTMGSGFTSQDRRPCRAKRQNINFQFHGRTPDQQSAMFRKRVVAIPS